MHRIVKGSFLLLALLAYASLASAEGCLKGAVVGDVVGSGVSLTMAGAVDTANYVMGNLSGSPASNLQRLAVKLLEV